MPRVDWPLLRGRPRIEALLIRVSDSKPQLLQLLADTGAGSAHSSFELVLRESDCMQFGQILGYQVLLAGAYRGPFSVYLVRIEAPRLGFGGDLRAVAIPNPPAGFDGIACFSFLNQFTYGNFGDPAGFGVKT
jgi:hypothetical protein